MPTKYKFAKYTGLATAAFLASFGFALAQSATPSSGSDATGPSAALEPMTAAKLTALTNGGQKPNVTNNTSVGWYYVHATYCVAYNGYLTVYPQEGGYWTTNYTLFQNTLEPECALGNWVAFYVYDTAGDFDRIQTYSYK